MCVRTLVGGWHCGPVRHITAPYRCVAGPPLRRHLPQLRGQPRAAPAPPSPLSFIIICREREPRRTVINKGHLKYETTTLTLGNISSVEQLVLPLSLWKGVPGAASPCPAPSSSLNPSPLPPTQPCQLRSWREKGTDRSSVGGRLGVLGRRMRGDGRIQGSALWVSL